MNGISTYFNKNQTLLVTAKSSLSNEKVHSGEDVRFTEGCNTITFILIAQKYDFFRLSSKLYWPGGELQPQRWPQNRIYFISDL
jgi:hypothetical protein